MSHRRIGAIIVLLITAGLLVWLTLSLPTKAEDTVHAVAYIFASWFVIGAASVAAAVLLKL